MYVSLWHWFNEYEDRAYLEQNADKQSLPQTAYKAWGYLRNVQPDLALVTFERGLKIAQKLNEPMWELFFGLWCCEILVYHKDDMKAAQDYTIRVVTRAHQPRYEPFPVIRSQVFFVLSNLYFMIDPFGYAAEIRDLLDFTEEAVPMAQDTHLRILSIRSALEFEHQEYDKSRQSTLAYLSLAQGNLRRMAGAHERLAAIAYAEGDIPSALAHAEQHEQLSQREDDKDDVALSQLWQAVFLQHEGMETQARLKHTQGARDFVRMGYVKRAAYYDAVCAYLELTDKADEALQFRQTQLAEKQHSIVHIAKAHLQICRLLGRMGQPLTDALAEARKIIPDMRKPDWYKAELKAIEANEYHEYKWQKPATIQQPTQESEDL
jgi:hypothetical protein